MIRYALIGACLMVTPAMADDGLPVTGMGAGTITISPGKYYGLMASIPDGGGPVSIDWPAVEATAADDRAYMSGIAKALLAVRDGTWVAMDGGKP